MDQQIPEEFICPITGCLMDDPAVVDDGHTFERQAIIQWFRSGKKTNPVTNLPLKNLRLRPNFSLKSLISKHKQKMKNNNEEENIQKIKVKIKQFALKLGKQQKVSNKNEQIKQTQVAPAQVFPEGWGTWSAPGVHKKSDNPYENWNNSLNNNVEKNGSWQNWGNQPNQNNHGGGILSAIWNWHS